MSGDDWPNKGDRLFEVFSWASDAPISNNPGERFYRLPMGYKRAGDILVEQAMADVVDRRNIIYAAVFCYRQSVELFLKRLLEEFGNRSDTVQKCGHDLKKLWDETRIVFAECCLNESIGIDAAEQLILELHQADARSDGFRFPTTRDGTEFEHGFQRIDLANLAKTISKLENFLDCASMALRERR
jgi:hypothetical protein